jgi:uncharacterized FAD-dependent dehydrogenase
MVEQMRAKIFELGGEVRFDQRVDKIHFVDTNNGENIQSVEGQVTLEGYTNKKVTGLTLSSGENIETNHIALAI